MDLRCGSKDGYYKDCADDAPASEYALTTDSLDLSRLDYLAFDALEKPLECLTKPVKLQPWNGQLRSILQLGSSSTALAYSEFSVGHFTETPYTSHHYQPALLHSLSQQHSETGDSGYMTQSFAHCADQYAFVRFNLEARHALNPSVTETTAAESVDGSLLSQYHLEYNESEGCLTTSSGIRPCSSVTRCQICGRVVKTLSDARKHALTHEKPYRCGESRCTRKDGFATLNDLQRHRKSVHSLHPTVGNPLGYICRACTPQDTKLPKFWPRRDNFKAHVRRKHSDWHEDELIEISRSERPGGFSNGQPPQGPMAQGRRAWRCDGQNNSGFEARQSTEVSPIVTQAVAKSDEWYSPLFPGSHMQEDALMAIGIHTTEALGRLEYNIHDRCP